MASLKPFEHFATDAIHAGQEPEKWNSRAVIPPISMSTTFKQDIPGETHVNIRVFRSFCLKRWMGRVLLCFDGTTQSCRQRQAVTDGIVTGVRTLEERKAG